MNTVTYTDPQGRWRIEKPEVLKHEGFPDKRITLFISQDRHTFFAVASYASEEYLAGNTGEGLRNAAYDALEQIYGKSVDVEPDGAEQLPPPWGKGVAFTTDKGSKGAAYFAQPGAVLVDDFNVTGDLHVYGILYGYKAANEAQARPMLLAMRDSFEIISQSNKP